jgi:hypothetical protein
VISAVRRDRVTLDTIDRLDWIIYQEIIEGLEFHWSKPETDTTGNELVLNVEQFKDRGTVIRNKKSIVYYLQDWVVNPGALH